MLSVQWVTSQKVAVKENLNIFTDFPLIDETQTGIATNLSLK